MVSAAHYCLLISLWLWSEGGHNFVGFLALACSSSPQYYSLSGRLVSIVGSLLLQECLCLHAPLLSPLTPFHLWAEQHQLLGQEPLGARDVQVALVSWCIASTGSQAGRKRKDAVVFC